MPSDVPNPAPLRHFEAQADSSLPLTLATSGSDQSKPIALFVNLDELPDSISCGNEVVGLKAEFDQQAERFEAIALKNSSLAEIESTLIQLSGRRIELIHFAGHADGNAANYSTPADVEKLMQLFHDAEPDLMFINGIGLNSGSLARDVVANELFEGCILVQQTVPDDIALRLCKGFYDLLLSGKSVKQAFALADKEVKTVRNRNNLPWDCYGKKLGYRGATTNEVAKWIGRAKHLLIGKPAFPSAVALLIQADAEGDLAESSREIDEIVSILNANDLCEPITLKNATVEDVERALDDYGERIEIIHFAGHANGKSILLESSEFIDKHSPASNEARPAYISGLAKQFDTKAKPKLVFINGCSSDQQASELSRLENIGWSILTEAAIDDLQARKLARNFYRRLAKGYDIKLAYIHAKNEVEASLETKTGNANSAKSAARSVAFGNNNPDAVPDQYPWRIFPGVKWRLGMTRLEEYDTGWRKVDFKYIALLALVCLILGGFFWAKVSMSSEGLLSRYLETDSRSELKLDFRLWEHNPAVGSEALKSEVIASLWPMNRIARNDSQKNDKRDWTLVLPSNIADDTLDLLTKKDMPIAQAPSRDGSLVALFGLGLLGTFLLFHLLRWYGCWHVRDLESEGDGVISWLSHLGESLKKERQGTLVLGSCLIGLMAYPVLCIDDSMHKRNSMPAAVNTIEIHGRSPKLSQTVSQLIAKADQFENLSKVALVMANVDDRVVNQLASLESAFVIQNEKPSDGDGAVRNDFQVSIDMTIESEGKIKPDRNIFLHSMIDPAVSQSLKTSSLLQTIENPKVRAPSLLQILAEEKQRFYANLRLIRDMESDGKVRDPLGETIKLGHSEGETDHYTIKFVSKKLPQAKDLLRRIDTMLNQLSRVSTQITIEPDHPNCAEIIELISDGAVAQKCIALDVSGNELSGAEIRKIKRMGGLKILDVSKCGLDQNKVQAILEPGGLNQLSEFFCYGNSLDAVELSEAKGDRNLQRLGSDAWAVQPADGQLSAYELLNLRKRDKRAHGEVGGKNTDENALDESALGLDSGLVFEDEYLELEPNSYRIADPKQIDRLSLFKQLKQVTFVISSKFGVDDIGKFNDKTFELSDGLRVEFTDDFLVDEKELKEYLPSIFVWAKNREVPSLSLGGISSFGSYKDLFLDLSSLEDSNVDDVTIEAPTNMVCLNGLTRPLHSLEITCPVDDGITRSHRKFIGIEDVLENDQAPPKIDNLSILNAVVHEKQLKSLLRFSPDRLNLSESEWENDADFDFEDFKECFAAFSNEGSKVPEIYLPFINCKRAPKMHMPLRVNSEFSEIPYFHELAESNVRQYLEQTRVLNEDSLFLLGDLEDIEADLKMFSKLKLNHLVNNLYVKCTEVDPQRCADVIGLISQVLKNNHPYQVPEGKPSLGLRGANERVSGEQKIEKFNFRKIQIKGNYIPDSAIGDLKLLALEYDVTGCPFATPVGLFEIGRFCRGRSWELHPIAKVGGLMGIGEPKIELAGELALENFCLDYSNAMITIGEQKRLEELRLFGEGSRWYSPNYRAAKQWKVADHSKLWNLNGVIWEFLESTNQTFRDRAVALGSDFDVLKESQVFPGLWPLYLQTKAALAAEQGDFDLAETRISEAIRLCDSIRKVYWTSEELIEHRKKYLAEFNKARDFYRSKQSRAATAGSNAPKINDLGADNLKAYKPEQSQNDSSSN